MSAWLTTLERIALESWFVLGEMAPYLLFGFLIAGVLAISIPAEWVEKHLGRGGFRPVLLAALFGVPLPLCSCGVIPVAASIRRHGASRAATASFLLSTPQTGVDSIAITYALLGWMVAVFRPLAALVTGLVGGSLVELFGEQESAVNSHRVGAANGAADSISTDPATNVLKPSDAVAQGGNPSAAGLAPAALAGQCQEECCRSDPQENAILRALRYGFVTLPRDIAAALLLGVVIAGAISALTPPGALAPYLGKGILSMLLMILVGMPLYVCASGSVPIAVGFMHLGASPGAALAFLIAGPATNAATITTIWKILGGRTVVIYLATIAAAAVGFGLLLDGCFSWLQLVPPMIDHQHAPAGAGGWIGHFWAVLLLTVLGVSYFWRPRGVSQSNAGHAHNEPSRTAASRGTQEHAVGAEPPSPPRDSSTTPPTAPAIALQSVTLVVRGMTCSHCVANVQRALAETGGVQSVEVSLRPPRAVIRGRDLRESELTAAVASLGYSAERVT